MLNLQSVAPVVIGGFHYQILETLANGSPVYDPSDLVHPQFIGNETLTANSFDGSGRVSGTADLGATGPTPTGANLGADLPAGMLGLPVNFDIQFIPLDGGPAISPFTQEDIFQNPSAFQYVPSPAPEPGTATLLLLGGLGLVRLGKRLAIGR
jgi:hypothetical protein